MGEVWTEIGFIRYPLVVTALFMVGQTWRAWRDIRREGASRAAPRVHAVLLWGVLGALFGILGTLIGVVQMARSIETAPAPPSGLVWGGIRVALTSSVMGFLLLSIAALLWMALHFTRRKRLTA